jgi:hypothetical protein
MGLKMIFSEEKKIRENRSDERKKRERERRRGGEGDDRDKERRKGQSCGRRNSV